MNNCPHFFQGEAGPTINILLYTDDLEVTDDSIKDWSLGVMLQHIRAHAPAFANLCIRLVSRNSTPATHADNRIDDLIKNHELDQIWFFGVHQGNRRNFTMEVLRGGPHSELDALEVAALEKWMQVGNEAGQRGGGVMVTGDHAEPRPPDALFPSPPPTGGPEFWSLGRALGIRVPRAGKMRAWEGPPTRRTTDSQNTQVLLRGTNFEDVLLQFDPNPQRLLLEPFDEKGEPSEEGQPHPLFFYLPGSFIETYPDHMHEGTIVLPSEEDLADHKIWPQGNIVRPHVVARGTDNSKKQMVNLIAVYNGDRAGVGRIVSDSTWHHYFNVNLNSFMPPGEINTPTDQIGQFYANLAVWLTPLPKRREMANAMVRWLATHPLMLEERVLEELNDEEEFNVMKHLGRKAYDLLSETASPCEIHELLCALLPDEVSANLETLYLPEKNFALGSFSSAEFLLPSKELLLGSLTNHYHRNVARAESSGQDGILSESAKAKIAAEAFQHTVKVQTSYVNRLASASVNWFQLEKGA